MPESLLPSTSPYKGPLPLERTDPIYGRRQEIEGLYDLICSSRIVLLHSPSGAGKTSLIQAGLLKKVEKDFEVLGPVRILPEGPAALLSRFTASLPQASPDESVYSRPRLWIIDQFEDILSGYVSEQECTDFFEKMGTNLQNPMNFALFVIREDVMAILDSYRSRIPTQFNNRFRIDFLTVPVATDCIAKPAAKAGYPFAPGAAEVIANLLGPEVEPVYLQVVCADLWDQLSKQKNRVKTNIDQDDVKELGDINQAISTYYDRNMIAISGANKGLEAKIRDWIGDKLITSTRQRNQVLGGADSTEGLENCILSDLIDVLLVRPETRGNSVWFELSHDRLIEPLLASNERFRASQSEIERACRRWLKSDRNDRFLLMGKELADLRANVDFDSLDADSRAFILACEAIESSANQADKDKARLERVSLLMAILFGMASAVTLASYFFVATVVNAPEVKTQYIYLVLAANLFGGLLAWPVFRVYINDQKLTDLLSKLARKHRSDPSLQSLASETPSPSTPPVADGDSGLISKWERQTLDFLPYWILLIIAGADSRITADEVSALRKALKKTRFSQRDAALEDFLKDPRPSLKGLSDATRIITSKLDAGEASKVRSECLRVAYSIAGRDEQAQQSLRFVKAVLEGEDPATLSPGLTRYYQSSGVASKASLALVCVGSGFAAFLLAFPYAWLIATAGGWILLILPILFGILLGTASFAMAHFADLRDNSMLKVVAPLTSFIAIYARWAITFNVIWPTQWLPIIQGSASRFTSPWESILVLGVAALEALLVSAPCFLAGFISTEGVYCENCSDWAQLNQNVLILNEPSNLDPLVADLENGKLASLESLIQPKEYSETAANWLAVDLESCTKCKDLNVLSLQKCSANTDKKGKRSVNRDEFVTQLLINRRMASWIYSRGNPD